MVSRAGLDEILSCWIMGDVSNAYADIMQLSAFHVCCAVDVHVMHRNPFVK